DRLLTEVTDIQQVRFGALSELTDGVDFLTLQAVVRTNGEVQILNRHAVGSDVLGLLWGWSDLDAFSSGVELASKAEELDQGATGGCQCIASRDRVLGFHVDDQLVKVGALLNTSSFNLVRDLQHWGVNLV